MTSGTTIKVSVAEWLSEGRPPPTIVPPYSFATYDDAPGKASPTEAAEDGVGSCSRWELLLYFMDQARVPFPQQWVVIPRYHNTVNVLALARKHTAALQTLY